MNAGGRAAAAVLSLAAMVGCGGRAAGELCGQTQACGGDLVGSWTVTHSCMSSGAAVAGVEDVLGGSCKVLTIDSVKTEHAGTITFAADLSFDASLTASGTVIVRLPQRCLGGQTCTQVGTTFMARGLSEAGCMGASSCACPIPRHPLAILGGGTYVAADGTLTLRFPSATEITRRYCVTDTNMHLFLTSGDQVIDDVLLTRVTR